ncbi:MAG TPA: lipid-A-disaccharide synthase-related protein [Halanaerobiales bacterium]|nr:lipid-A-disaccharide synthase-related protein [Halanaerobiales bacterium]
MKNSKSILFVSNGHGEDLIAANLIKSLLAQDNNLSISELPVVGKGNTFEKMPVEILGPRETLPSGGFARNSWQNLWNDLKGGLISNTYKQIQVLRGMKNKVDLSVVVGDVYILTLTGFFTGGDIVFLPTAKSEYINGHFKIEKHIMKRYADLVLPRDNKTTNNLKSFGIKTKFFGNLMMDCFEIKGLDFNLRENSTKIGILPGSRDDAYDNMLDFINVIEELERLKKEKYDFLTAVAGNFSVEKLKNKLKGSEWQALEQEDDYIKLQIISPSKASAVSIIYNGFGDVLDQAKLFLGMAGTANEQAVGMGKPVVTFPGTGVQFDYEFAADQKRLLGEGVKFVDRNFKNVAYALIELLEDEQEYNKRSKAGQKRMGDRGAIKKVSNLIFQDFLFDI